MATVGALTAGRFKPGGRTRRAIRDDDRVAGRDGADVHRKTHRTALRDEAEVAGDDARSLNGLIGRRGCKDNRNAERLNDGGIEKRRGQLLEIVGQREQVAANIEKGVAVNTRPERGVGGIFADQSVVADELDGEGVVMDQQLRRNGELGFGSRLSEPPNWPGVG